MTALLLLVPVAPAAGVCAAVGESAAVGVKPAAGEAVEVKFAAGEAFGVRLAAGEALVVAVAAVLGVDTAVPAGVAALGDATTVAVLVGAVLAGTDDAMADTVLMAFRTGVDAIAVWTGVWGLPEPQAVVATSARPRVPNRRTERIGCWKGRRSIGKFSEAQTLGTDGTCPTILPKVHSSITIARKMPGGEPCPRMAALDLSSPGGTLNKGRNAQSKGPTRRPPMLWVIYNLLRKKTQLRL